MSFFCCGSDTDNVCGSSDGSGASSDIRSHGQCPGKNRDINTRSGCCQVGNNRDHCCCKRNVVDEGAGNRGNGDDNRNHQSDISAADFLNDTGKNLQDTSLLQASYNNEKADKEEKRLIIDLL